MVIMVVIRPQHVAVTEQNIQTNVALDGNPEPDQVHATGCKQPTLRYLTCFHIKKNSDVKISEDVSIGTWNVEFPKSDTCRFNIAYTFCLMTDVE
jgi:hypothetical protein